MEGSILTLPLNIKTNAFPRQALNNDFQHPEPSCGYLLRTQLSSHDDGEFGCQRLLSEQQMQSLERRASETRLQGA